MKTKLFLVIVLLALCANSFGQNSSWTKWTWLIGEWKGEGSGQPGQGSGTFSFKTDLNEKVLVRKAHSEYPSKDNTAVTIHDDLLIVYFDFSGNPSKAIYFDNEGHTINYSISYSDKNIIFLSDKIPNVPTFRLTYTLLDNEMINTKFEMSRDGVNFMTYVEGKSKKIK
jgi:hypothetical protein